MYTFGFKYNQGASNIEGLFSTIDNLELENSTVTINGKEVPILDVLADINIREFSNKVLTNKALLNEYETVFNNLLEMFDYYLDTNFLSDKGLETL
jgi:UDP-3-O-acyl-N-acetylglucosamine deacetylase